MTIKEASDKNAHIKNDEFLLDIADTEREIRLMERAKVNLTLLASQGDKMSHMRLKAANSGIEDRQNFIDDLQAILDYRNGKTQGQDDLPSVGRRNI